MTARSVLVAAVQSLKAAQVHDAARDARRLLCHALDIDISRLTLALGDEMPKGAKTRFDELIARRIKREPVSQILGYRDFYGLRFEVTRDVLDPRPETETLVETVLGFDFETVADIGTGSGCILLSLLAARAGAKGIGVDVSQAALAVAKRNARSLGLLERVTFTQSNWFETVQGQFDVIVSNPPYIDEKEWETLEPEPKDWEPKLALTPGVDGLTPYRGIAANAPRHLTAGGWLAVEIGWQQGDAVKDIFETNGFSDVQVIQDLGGRDRVVAGCNQP
jgi:release factor glutamine methyltransferase